MKTIDEIRRDNLGILIQEAKGELSLSERYGCTEANIKTMARAYKDSKSGTPKGIGTAAARKLEQVMGKDRGWLDHDWTLSDTPAAQHQVNDAANSEYANNVTTLPQDAWISELLSAARATTDDGRRELIGMAKLLASQKPRTKSNRSN